MYRNEEGFSLLELVVAVGVAGIIAAVALPTFAGIQSQARTTSSTYAASASAAEAAANAAIAGYTSQGNWMVSGNNSSYIGGNSNGSTSSYGGSSSYTSSSSYYSSSSSSSSNVPVGLVTYTLGVDYTGGTFYATAGSGSGMWAIAGASSTLSAALASHSSWTITVSKPGFSGSYVGGHDGATTVYPWPLSSEFPWFSYDLNSIQINATTGEVFIQL